MGNFFYFVSLSASRCRTKSSNEILSMSSDYRVDDGGTIVCVAISYFFRRGIPYLEEREGRKGSMLEGFLLCRIISANKGRCRSTVIFCKIATADKMKKKCKRLTII